MESHCDFVVFASSAVVDMFGHAADGFAVSFGQGYEALIEGRIESFSVGKGNITPEKMDEIAEISARHGFDLAPFYSGGRLVTEEQLAELREEFARHH